MLKVVHLCEVICEYVGTKGCSNTKLKFDKHTPDLFKLEFQGEAILPLCSKSYICVSSFVNKLAHKGVRIS